MVSSFGQYLALKVIKVGIFIMSLCFSNNTLALEIDFEDAFSALGHEGDPSSFYSSQGLTINGNYFGILEGVSRGDSGNFDLEGTAGPASLAINLSLIHISEPTRPY